MSDQENMCNDSNKVLSIKVMIDDYNSDTEKSDWLSFPIDDIDQAMNKIARQFFVDDWTQIDWIVDNSIVKTVIPGIADELTEYPDFDLLNEISKIWMSLDEKQKSEMTAAIDNGEEVLNVFNLDGCWGEL